MQLKNLLLFAYQKVLAKKQIFKYYFKFFVYIFFFFLFFFLFLNYFSFLLFSIIVQIYFFTQG